MFPTWEKNPPALPKKERDVTQFYAHDMTLQCCVGTTQRGRNVRMGWDNVGVDQAWIMVWIMGIKSIFVGYPLVI